MFEQGQHPTTLERNYLTAPGDPPRGHTQGWVGERRLNRHSRKPPQQMRGRFALIIFVIVHGESQLNALHTYLIKDRISLPWTSYLLLPELGQKKKPPKPLPPHPTDPTVSPLLSFTDLELRSGRWNPRV